ncbi:MAG: nucleotide exchange factor GrpE [Pseudomonadales bacterium]
MASEEPQDSPENPENSNENQPLEDDLAGVAGAPDELGQSADIVETLQAEVASLKDQLLRSQAEMENVRRRATRDVENAHKYAIEKFAGELLPVADSLEKAVETAQSAASSAEGDADATKAIAEGVELSLKLFVDKLAKGGLEQIDPLGHPFDPQQHEAMAMVPNPDAEPNSVIDVMQKGYLLNGRLVRAAMVVVAKAADG